MVLKGVDEFAIKIMSFLFSLKKSSAELKKILANGQVSVIT